jgi:hypothetical protein
VPLQTLQSARGFGFSKFIATAAGSYESIATFTGSSTSNIEFTNIPGTYTHLQIRCITKDNRSGVSANNFNMIINNNTNQNYTDHYVIGDGASVSGYGAMDLTSAAMGISPSGTSTANVFGVSIIDILDYTNTNKIKIIRSLQGFESNGTGNLRYRTSIFDSLNAITSIKISVENTGDFNSNAHFALYGIKGVS